MQGYVDIAVLSYYLVVGFGAVLLRGRRAVVLSCVGVVRLLCSYCFIVVFLMCCSCVAPMCSRWCNGVFVSLCIRIRLLVWLGGVAIAVLLCWL